MPDGETGSRLDLRALRSQFLLPDLAFKKLYFGNSLTSANYLVFLVMPINSVKISAKLHFMSWVLSGKILLQFGNILFKFAGFFSIREWRASKSIHG